ARPAGGQGERGALRRCALRGQPEHRGRAGANLSRSLARDGGNDRRGLYVVTSAMRHNVPPSNIEARGLTVVYANGHVAIKSMSFTLTSGTITGLAGINGSGKPTLFKAIMGFVRPTEGEIRIGGRPVADALRRRAIAYVPQSEDVDWDFPVLVEDVVMMGRYGHMGFLRIPSKADREKVDEALARVD